MLQGANSFALKRIPNFGSVMSVQGSKQKLTKVISRGKKQKVTKVCIHPAFNISHPHIQQSGLSVHHGVDYILSTLNIWNTDISEYTIISQKIV